MRASQQWDRLHRREGPCQIHLSGRARLLLPARVGAGHVGRYEPELLGDLFVDLRRDIVVLFEELPCILASLTKLLAVVRVPGPGFLDDFVLHADIEQRAFTRDSLTKDDVKLTLGEWGSALVLHDLHANAVAHEGSAVLERLDA